MSKYELKQPNRQFNDWDSIEQQIMGLDKRIDEAVAGETSFDKISGEPSDNEKLAEALNEKADKSTTYTKTETDTLLDDKANVGDSYTKSEEDALLADKADKTDLDSLEDRVDGIDDTVTDIQTDLGDKVDKEEGKELMDSTLPTQVQDNKTDIDALKLKVQDIQIIQMRTMPTPGTDYLGKIVQYIGPTVEAYTNGYFYQCDYDTDLADYTWIQKMTQPAGEVDLSNYYTKIETDNLMQNKQDKLTAGDGIKIQGNTIMQNILDDTISSASTTWSSRYLESLFHSLSGLSAIEIVDARPAVPVNNTMYYVKAYEEGEEPLYEIWFYQNNTWTNFGTTAIDLTNYYTKAEVDALLANKQATLTEGTGIRIANNNVEVKIDGTTIKVNSAGNLYVEGGGGGGGGKTYYDGQGIQVDNTNNVINANVDGETVEVNNQSKIQVKKVPSNKIETGVDETLDTKLSDIDTELDDRYTKTEVDDIADNLDAAKADKVDTYTKTEVDTSLSGKYNKTGGELSGTITAGDSVENIIKNSKTNGQLTIYSGTSYNNGAFLGLSGKDDTSRPGWFRLSAQSGTNSKDLVGKPDGTLQWDGKNVITNNGNKSWTNISFASGTTGNGKYCIKNGICIVKIITVTKSASTSWSIAATGLPTPDDTGDMQFRLNDMTGNGTITQTGQMWMNNGTFNGQIIYPVKNL